MVKHDLKMYKLVLIMSYLLFLSSTNIAHHYLDEIYKDNETQFNKEHKNIINIMHTNNYIKKQSNWDAHNCLFGQCITPRQYKQVVLWRAAWRGTNYGG